MKRFISIVILVALSTLGLNAQDKNNQEGDVFFIVDDMPEYPGGEAALRNDIASLVKYPLAAKENGIQGKVYITFVVNEEGKIEGSKIARGVDPSLDKEALRVMNGLDKTWKPGKKDGVPVKVSYTVPIKFALDTEAIKNKETSYGEGANQVFFIVEDMPEFPGGDEALREFIANEVTYPEVAHKNGIQGKVYVTFVVEKDGSVGDVKIARGVDPSLDKEALRVVKALPQWKPGQQRGEAVRVSYTVPINFALKGDSSEEQKMSKGTDTDQVFFTVEDMPEFPGGDDALKKYIANSLSYPEIAQKNKIQGKVYVSFVVEKDGSIGEAKIERGVDPSLDKEALRVVKGLPQWKPGKQRGTTVRVKYTVPINFALN